MNPYREGWVPAQKSSARRELDPLARDAIEFAVILLVSIATGALLDCKQSSRPATTQLECGKCICRCEVTQ